MRIALVHMRHAQSGGTECHLDQVAAHLAERGHEVTIVCRSHEAPPHPEVRFLVLHDLALGSAWRMWAFARAVERRLARSEFDLVYGLGKTWTQDVIRLGGGLHASYLARAHGWTLTRWERWARADRLKQRLALRIEARALTQGHYVHVVANSEMVKRDGMRRHAIPAERITVIHNGVDLVRFRPENRDELGPRLRRELGIEPAAPVVLFLGSGYGRKGLDRLLEAFPALLAERPAARLLVVGRDSDPASHRAHARRLGIAGAVRFLGRRPDTPALYAASDLYCLPTRYDSFGLTILEALASGLPVVTTRSAGGSEAIDPGVQGSVLGEAAEAEELAAELCGWCVPGRIEAARSAARSRAELFSQERTARRSAELLERLHERGERVLRKSTVRSHPPPTHPG